MTIRAKSADGTIHQFPDGTSQEVIGAAMKRHAEFSKLAATRDERGGAPTGGAAARRDEGGATR